MLEGVPGEHRAERHSRVPLHRRALEGRAVPQGIGSALSQVLPQTGAPVVANNKCKPGCRYIYSILHINLGAFETFETQFVPVKHTANKKMPRPEAGRKRGMRMRMRSLTYIQGRAHIAAADEQAQPSALEPRGGALCVHCGGWRVTPCRGGVGLGVGVSPL